MAHQCSLTCSRRKLQNSTRILIGLDGDGLLDMRVCVCVYVCVCVCMCVCVYVGGMCVLCGWEKDREWLEMASPAMASIFNTDCGENVRA